VAATDTAETAGLDEITRIYAIRNWTGQNYKQVKDKLGWADFQVRSDVAILRQQALANCALSCRHRRRSSASSCSIPLPGPLANTMTGRILITTSPAGRTMQGNVDPTWRG
jgi:hypothetical protein